MISNLAEMSRQVLGAIPLIRGLVCYRASDTTIKIDITSCICKGFATSLDATWDSELGTSLNGWDDDGVNINTGKTEHFIWLIQNKLTGALSTVASFNKSKPDITKSIFTDYEVVTILTHFVTGSTTSRILGFYKKNNFWHFHDGEAGTTEENVHHNGIYVGYGSSVYTSPKAFDLTNGAPLIPEIEKINIRGSMDADSPWSAGYVDGNLHQSTVGAFRWELIQKNGSSNNCHWRATIPYTQQYLYGGGNNGQNIRLFLDQCHYSNIISF